LSFCLATLLEIFQDGEMKTTPSQNTINLCSLFLIVLLLICFALFQKAEAVTPPPDGGYPGGNTAEGQNALLNLTTGTFNTAVGWFSLQGNVAGNLNTAIGAATLATNTADIIRRQAPGRS
jgi:hypothetical protein